MVEVTNLSKSYGDKVALRNISFSIEPGQVVGLLGLNGAGKSTTMNILTGYISATSGKVAIDGHDILSQGRKAKSLIGYLPEQPSFYPEMRVDEHLNFICDLKGVYKNKSERMAHLDEVSQRVGINQVRKRMIRNLSKGYRQRVGFAQALIGSPKVIILDEPTAGLDPSQIIEIRKLIKECGKTSTVIVSSHILFEIGTVCDRVIVIHEGQMIADGTPESLTGETEAVGRLIVQIKGEAKRVTEALLKMECVEQVDLLGEVEPGVHEFILSPKEECDIREELFRELAKLDFPLLSSQRAGTSLEDVFLRLTGRESGHKESSYKGSGQEERGHKEYNHKESNYKESGLEESSYKKSSQKEEMK